MMSRRGIAPLIIIVILALAVVAGAYSYGRIYHPGSVMTPLPGQAIKDPNTGLYTIYVVVYGHRDRTPLHLDMRANVHVDSVSVYYTNPGPEPSGDTWGGLDKSISVTVQVSGGSLSAPQVSSFVMPNVALGASWGQVVTFSLPSGTYALTATGVDQGGYQSSATATTSLG